jgi:hypothetical protein
MGHFLAYVARAGPLDEQQQVNIYTSGLLKPLKTNVKLQNPQHMEMPMSLARAYERHLAVLSDANTDRPPSRSADSHHRRCQQ